MFQLTKIFVQENNVYNLLVELQEGSGKVRAISSSITSSYNTSTNMRRPGYTVGNDVL